MFETDGNKSNSFSIFVAILGMHNLITNAQLCNIVGSSNGVDQEHFSSKYLIIHCEFQSFIKCILFSPCINFNIYMPNVLYMYLKLD